MYVQGKKRDLGSKRTKINGRERSLLEERKDDRLRVLCVAKIKNGAHRGKKKKGAGSYSVEGSCCCKAIHASIPIYIYNQAWFREKEETREGSMLQGQTENRFSLTFFFPLPSFLIHYYTFHFKVL